MRLEIRGQNIFVGAWNAAIQNNAPILPVRLWETQALEWDCNESKVSAPGKATFGTP